MVTPATLPAAAETDEPAAAYVTRARRRFVQVIPDALTEVARAAGLDLTERAALLELVLAADWRTGTLPRTTGRDLGHLWGVSPNTAIRLRRRLEAGGLIACSFERGREDGSVEVLCYGALVAGWQPPTPGPVDNTGPAPVARAEPARPLPQNPRERPAGPSPSRRWVDPLPPPPPPSGPVDELLEEAGGRLPEPNRRQRRRLAELLAELDRLGWHPAAVRANALARELETADVPIAALIARLARLGPPPTPPAIYVAPPEALEELPPEIRSTGRTEVSRLRRRLAELGDGPRP